MCDALLLLLLAERDIKTGCTMEWMKCSTAVSSRHKFLQIWKIEMRREYNTSLFVKTC